MSNEPRFEFEAEIRLFDKRTGKRYRYAMSGAVNGDDDTVAVHRVAELLETETAVGGGRSIRRESSHDMHERAGRDMGDEQR